MQKKGRLNENQILAVVKNPGEKSYVEPLFDNTLEAFQKAVGGYIEAITLCTDFALIVNEEGILKELPYNTTVCGQPLFGSVIAVGIKGDEFSSLKSSWVPKILRLLNGGEYA